MQIFIKENKKKEYVAIVDCKEDREYECYFENPNSWQSLIVEGANYYDVINIMDRKDNKKIGEIELFLFLPFDATKDIVDKEYARKTNLLILDGHSEETYNLYENLRYENHEFNYRKYGFLCPYEGFIYVHNIKLDEEYQNKNIEIKIIKSIQKYFWSYSELLTDIFYDEPYSENTHFRRVFWNGYLLESDKDNYEKNMDEFNKKYFSQGTRIIKKKKGYGKYNFYSL